MNTDVGKTERVATERVRELLGAATPGPWTVFDDAEPLVLIEAPDPEDPRARLIVAELAGGPANAALIATAPDLAVDLLDAREEIARLRAEAASDRQMIWALGEGRERLLAEVARLRVELDERAADIAPLDLDAIDREAARLLDGITPEPWKLSLIQGVPMLYGPDGVSPVAFTMYAETATADGCPQADANAALIEAAPALARRVRALVARLGALVWAVLDERRMKALHRAALREEINAAILDTDSDRENAAMAESRETAEAAEEAAARLDELLRGAPAGVIPADVVRRYLTAEAGYVEADSDSGDAMLAARAEVEAALLAAAGGAPR